MPNPHYQRVLESDRQLPTPLRLVLRTLSAWPTILSLGTLLLAYLAALFLPLGGRYLWQQRAIDTTQTTALAWWPLHVLMALLACVLVCAAVRRLPWRFANLGGFLMVFGLAITLVAQSFVWRLTETGVAAVPLTRVESDTPAAEQALSLSYTTRMGDPADRVLVVMVSGAAPVTVPLDGLPLWNDTVGDAMPSIKLHDDPTLASTLGFGTRVEPVAYIAHGTLTDQPDGRQTATPSAPDARENHGLPYPAEALLALRLTADKDDGTTGETTVWLPFEPEGADALVTKRFYQVDGLGTVGLAFRPVSRKIPFAIAASEPQTPTKMLDATLHIADSGPDGRLLQPSAYRLRTGPARHTAIGEQDTLRDYLLRWRRANPERDTALVSVTTRPGSTFVFAGLATCLTGLLYLVIQWLIGVLQRPEPRDDHRV